MKQRGRRRHASRKALVPVIRNRGINQSLVLYSGHLTVTSGGKQRAGNGRVEFRWLPTPRLEFSLTSSRPPWRILHDSLDAPAHLRIPGRSRAVDITITAVRGRDSEIHGRIQDSVAIGGGKLDEVRFDVANFHWFYGTGIWNRRSFWAGRAEIRFDDWRIVLDERQGAKRIIERLKRDGGYALTHTAQISRVNGVPNDNYFSRPATTTFPHLE